MSKKKTAKPAAKRAVAKKTAKPVKKAAAKPAKKAVAKKMAPTVKKAAARKTAAPVKPKAVKKTAPPAKKAPAVKIAPPVPQTPIETTSAQLPETSQYEMAAGPGIIFRISFPQGDTVDLGFEAAGTSPGKNITKVLVTQDNVPVADVTWTEKQAPTAPTGAWIVTVTMPDISMGAYDIDIADNLGNADTGSLVI